jgi:3-isopropylmalate/(R)-2-methylmalate dehydratase small subunit
MSKIRGRVWTFGDDIDTDQIYPGKYLPLTDKAEMALHAMEGVPGSEGFTKGSAPGDIVVAGKNFGCGSSREHAPVSLREKGIALVIARTFARIFYRNAVNIGLPILECGEVERFQDGDEIEVDPLRGEIRNLRDSSVIRAKSLSSLEMEIMRAGGLIRFLKRRKRPKESR